MVRICIVTSFDPDDKNAWSGALWMMIAALNSIAQVQVVRAPTKTAMIDRLFAKFEKQLFRGAKYLWNFGLSTSRLRGSLLRRTLRDLEFDVVLSIAASSEVSFLRNKSFQKPIVSVGDATFRQLVDFYPDFTNLSWLSRFQGEVLARRSVKNAKLMIMPSDWAVDSLRIDYGVPDSSLKKIEFGASHHRQSGPIKKRHRDLGLLCLASNWQRKDGARVVQIITEVRARGHEVRLTIVGDYPPDLPAWIECIPSVSRDKLPELFEKHDVLIDMAIANAFSLAIVDALAMGLPVIANNVGGVAGMVKHQLNGFLLDNNGDAAEQVCQWVERLSSKHTYQEFSLAALEIAAQKLTWERWAQLTFEACESKKA